MGAAKLDITGHLTSKQALAVTALASGATDTEAAKVAKVSRQTLNGWKNHSAPFIQALRIEQNRFREAKIKDTLEKHCQLKEAAFDTILKGIKAGDLVSSRWYLEKYSLSEDLKLLQKDSHCQECDENLHTVLLDMAKAKVKKILDKEDVETFERKALEQHMTKKTYNQLVKEYVNREVE